MLMSSVNQNPVGMAFFCPTISGPSEMKIYPGSNSGGPDCHPKAPSLTCVGSGWTGLEAGLSGPITWCLHVPESRPGLSHPGSCIPGGVSPGHVKRARKKLVAYCDQAPVITESHSHHVLQDKAVPSRPSSSDVDSKCPWNLI